MSARFLAAMSGAAGSMAIHTPSTLAWACVAIGLMAIAYAVELELRGAR